MCTLVLLTEIATVRGIVKNQHIATQSAQFPLYYNEVMQAVHNTEIFIYFNYFDFHAGFSMKYTPSTRFEISNTHKLIQNMHAP